MALFNIYTLGCKVNQYDSSNLRKKLIKSGLIFTPKNAEIVIINTCSVTGSAIRKNKQMASRAKKENPQAKIILTGCWPKVYKAEAKKIGADYICDIDNISELLKKILIIGDKFEKGCDKNFSFIDRSRYFIKIQDGCEQYCSYCVIPYARGRLKSRPAEEIINEIQEAVKNGFREIVLTGIHLGLYGKDFKNNKKEFGEKIDLVSLLKQLLKIKDLGRIRLSSIEATEVSDELIKLMKGANKICRHLHIPLQSGSDKILKRMNRPYDKKYFKRIINKTRKALPDIAVTTDIIVGFPGETKKDFNDAVKFIKEVNFSKIHVFSFSAHPKTPAFHMDNKVEQKEIEERSKILRVLSEKSEKLYKNKFKGRELEVVIDNRKIEGKFLGKSEYYFDILFELTKNEFGYKIRHNNLVGRIIKVKYKK